MSENLAERAARAGTSLLQRLHAMLDPAASSPAGGRHAASGWMGVTVLTGPDEIDPAAPPLPLAELADRIDIRVRPAPGGKGTELGARLRQQPGRSGAASSLSGQDQESQLRSALRQAKQLIEVGEVLAVDPAPHGERTSTPGGALLEAWTKAAPGAGVR